MRFVYLSPIYMAGVYSKAIDHWGLTIDHSLARADSIRDKTKGSNRFAQLLLLLG